MQHGSINPPAHVREAEVDILELMKRLRNSYARIKANEKATLEEFLDMGTMLETLRPTVAHGQWMPTLEKLGIPQQRASEAIRAAKLPEMVISECESVEDVRQALKKYEADMLSAENAEAQDEPGDTEEEETPAETAFCDRCHRTGPVTNCKACKELREQTGHKKDKPKRSKPSANGTANGQCAFSWKEAENEFGKALRVGDSVVRAFPQEKASARYQKWVSLQNEAALILKDWKASLKKG